jgi:hypothetical protein
VTGKQLAKLADACGMDLSTPRLGHLQPWLAH